ncbi:GGDEF domain-containing protein [Psychromonas ossibalaenae]|uniref:GGDEF domain-containing protein n=1 Tax=Psychromonas ossibalaenae TaxID=444922 RepID=UPI00035D2B49|nr:GGDEF domain-containing protein [Psychromonas ossibalaenae]
MHTIKYRHKKNLVSDIILLLLLNVLFWLSFGKMELFELLYEYSRSHEELELDEFIPLTFVLMLSFMYFAIRRWIDSVKFAAFAEQQASTDSLTELLNRRAIEYKLASEWHRFIRYKEPFCLVILDIDDFKKINDNFGHLKGDEILKEVAEKLDANTRKTDFCARWGGEEFLILCPVSELAQAIVLAEKLRINIHRAVKGRIELSASLGVSQADPNTSLQDVIKRADLALYKAKLKGKNCVSSD